MKNLVICGDSFNIGIGCKDLKTEPYGHLLAERLGLNLINLAKGSSTNFSIYFQVEYAVKNIKDIDLLIVSSTCFHRTEFFNKKSHYSNDNTPISNTSINYHQYPPYGPNTYLPDQIIEHPMINNPDYKPTMYTENFHGILDFVETAKKPGFGKGQYYARFDDEDLERFELYKKYYLDIWSPKIQKWYDIGMINLSHSLLKANKIPHLVLVEDPELRDVIDKKNMCWMSWGQLSLKYPDELNTYHTSKEGHIEACNIVLDKLRNSLI